MKVLREKDLVVAKASNRDLMKVVAPCMWPDITQVDKYKKHQLSLQPKPGLVYRLVHPVFDYRTEHKAPALIVFLTVLIVGVMGAIALKDYKVWDDHSPILESLIFVTCAIGWYLYQFECAGPKIWMFSSLKDNGSFFNNQEVAYDFIPPYAINLIRNIKFIMPDAANFSICYIGDDSIITCVVDGELFVPLIFDKDGVVTPV